jgi:hypothetical protein
VLECIFPVEVENLIVDFWEKAVPLNSRTAFLFHPSFFMSLRGAARSVNWGDVAIS